jgi:thymidylate kinase
MHIILEGIDKSGKTTLAKYLSKELNMPIQKVSAPKIDPFIEYVNLLIDTKIPTIFDRFHIGEMVYGPIKRGKSQLDFRKRAIVEMLMNGLETYNIYCDGPVNVIARRFVEDKEDYLTVDEIPEVLEAYNHQIADSFCYWNSYHVGDDMSKVAENYQRRDVNEKQKWLEYRTVGNYNKAKYLFVGEKYGWEHNQPLIPFGNGQPGLMLYTALDKLGILKDSLVTNAKKDHRMIYQNDVALIDEILLPNVQIVIALGLSAYNIVNHAMRFREPKKWVIKTPHPAWAARKGLTIGQYTAIIKRALNI